MAPGVPALIPTSGPTADEAVWTTACLPAQSRGPGQTYSVKGYTVNGSDTAGLEVSATTAQLRSCIATAATDNT